MVNKKFSKIAKTVYRVKNKPYFCAKYKTIAAEIFYYAYSHGLDYRYDFHMRLRG